MIIGLIGTIASGKGLISEYLKSKGFQQIILSDFIKKELEKENKSFSRTNLQDKGNELRNKFGAGILAIKALEGINKENVVIDGIRNLAEIDEIKKKNAIIIGIDAPVEVRWKRYEKGLKENIKSYKEFIERDLRDRKEQIEHGLQIDQCLEKADFKIINNLGKEDLYRKVERVLIKWKK